MRQLQVPYLDVPEHPRVIGVRNDVIGLVGRQIQLVLHFDMAQEPVLLRHRTAQSDQVVIGLYNLTCNALSMHTSSCCNRCCTCRVSIPSHGGDALVCSVIKDIVQVSASALNMHLTRKPRS